MRLDHTSENLARCTIHDRSQFEVQFNYDLSEGGLNGQPHERYRVEAYYFFPSSMGISSLSFPRDAFYRSLNAYIRFRSPEISELQLLDPLNRQSPLNTLSFQVKQIGDGQPVDQQTITNEARLFGAILSGLIRRRLGELDQKMAAAKARPGDSLAWRELEGGLGEFLAEMPELLGKYRAVMLDFRGYGPRLVETTMDRLRHVDEYLTYRFDHALAELHFLLQSTWESPTRMARIGDQLHAVADAEADYRARAGYIVLAPGDEQAQALYTYRSGALKKLIDQVLYLDVKTIQETLRWKNTAAAFGALIAAYFAALTQMGALRLNSEHIFLAMTIFAFAYVVKDRIKEVLREKLWARISRYFPDNKLLIQDPTKAMEVGKCHERVVYLSKSQVPADVLRVRNTQHVVDLDAERKETVVLYQNDLNLYAREILAAHQRRTDIKHILRFSIEDLLGRLDNPTARVQFYDPQSRIFCRMRAPKTYHLNVVFRLTHWDAHGRKELPHYHRIRVVIDKNGIHRIDTVTHAKEASPSPAHLANRKAAQALEVMGGDEQLF